MRPTGRLPTCNNSYLYLAAHRSSTSWCSADTLLDDSGTGLVRRPAAPVVIRQAAKPVAFHMHRAGRGCCTTLACCIGASRAPAGNACAHAKAWVPISSITQQFPCFCALRSAPCGPGTADHGACTSASTAAHATSALSLQQRTLITGRGSHEAVSAIRRAAPGIRLCTSWLSARGGQG